LQNHFLAKRDRMVSGLKSLGIRVDHAPEGGFYCWGDLSALPDGLNTGMKFFREALEHGVIVVPGEFFDINPGQRRADRPSRFRHHVRFSFGPSMDTIDRGLAGLAKMLGT
ncbi:MAG: aspartate aminotransferase, partial [Deltaproteobacteria bacterium]|nr:aspartate aminotransferase [Deltaproteobacteria bacterium]